VKRRQKLIECALAALQMSPDGDCVTAGPPAFRLPLPLIKPPSSANKSVVLTFGSSLRAHGATAVVFGFQFKTFIAKWKFAGPIIDVDYIETRVRPVGTVAAKMPSPVDGIPAVFHKEPVMGAPE
jgi:hypothetical protein